MGNTLNIIEPANIEPSFGDTTELVMDSEGHELLRGESTVQKLFSSLAGSSEVFAV